MTNDFDPEFRKKIRRMIIERLAEEAVAGGSWKLALEGLKDIFEIDQDELELEMKTCIDLKAWDNEPSKTAVAAPIDLNAQRAQRQMNKAQKAEASFKPPAKPTAKGGSYGEGVRAQVFEVVVRQGIAGAPWRSICAGPMAINNIDPDEVQREINRRKRKPGRDRDLSADEEDFDPPPDGGGVLDGAGGGKPKARPPKNPFPFFGGHGKASKSDDESDD
jgi:hypothetical protein